MDLFNPNPHANLLPQDGEVIYYGPIIPVNRATAYFEDLFQNLPWKADEAILHGKHYVTDRKVVLMGDRPFVYRYSGVTKTALPWAEPVLELKQLAEKTTGHTYNSCLANLYHNGSESMAWHSDGERNLQKDGAIASVSLGAERKFSFKHKDTQAKVDVLLQHGSILVMKGTCQTHWLHRLPPTKKVQRPRISLTFRTIVE
ncbi:MAG TPA: alpha-ketoglutarate-dependent dioxygenase AlkB [Cytophagales bacterium]|nr:alpha-ketoglutarate-dependent dioxygenase AlkB [Cytophagales bacterium]